MQKPKMSLDGVKYRLKTMEHSVNMKKAYPEAGYEDEINHDKKAIIKGFIQRDAYIEHLEREIQNLKEGITPVLNLYRINNPSLNIGKGWAFVVATEGEEAIQKAREYYQKRYDEAFTDGMFGDLRAELLLTNIHVQDIHASPIYYW